MRTSFVISIVAAVGLGACAPSGPSTDPASDPLNGGRSAGSVIDRVDYLELPGPTFYPSALAATANGTLFVGGILGEIVKFSPSSIDPVVVLEPAAPPNAPIVIPGMLADDASRTLYVCGNIFTAAGGNPFASSAASLYAYDFDGKLKTSYPLPNQGHSICTDLVFDDHHNLYITEEAVGAIDLLKSGSSTIAEWTSGALLEPSTANPNLPPFGAHNAAYVDEGGNEFLYVTNFTKSTLVKIPVNADGSAGRAVQQAVMGAPAPVPSIALANPEGIRTIDADHLVGTMGPFGSLGSLIEYVRTAPDTWTITPLRNNLKGPTTVVASKGSYWITEAQAAQFILWAATGKAPTLDLPFKVVREDILE